jgi:hypothetical protein
LTPVRELVLNQGMKTQATVVVKKNLCEKAISSTYGVGIRQLRHMRMRGDGPLWIKVSGSIGVRGGRILYPVDEFERWLSRLPSGGGATRAAHPMNA